MNKIRQKLYELRSNFSNCLRESLLAKTFSFFLPPIKFSFYYEKSTSMENECFMHIKKPTPPVPSYPYRSKYILKFSFCITKQLWLTSSAIGTTTGRWFGRKDIASAERMNMELTALQACIKSSSTNLCWHTITFYHIIRVVLLTAWATNLSCCYFPYPWS